MSERDLFDELDQMDGVPWEDIGRINQEGYVDTDPIGDHPRIFDDQFEMRSREKERTPNNLQPVTIVPSRPGPWSANNQLGIEQPFAPDTNNLQTILKLDEWGFPEVWTVSLGLDFDELALRATDFFGIIAILQFGIGGVVQEIEVDWKNGTSIPLPFNALNIRARYNIANLGRVISTIPSSLRLRASIARGTVSGTEATRSQLSLGQPLLIEIPKFAKSLLLLTPRFASPTPFAFYTSPWTVQFIGNPISSAIGSGVYAMSQFASWIDTGAQLVGGPQWIPVPPYARFVRVADAFNNVVTEDAMAMFRVAY